MDNKIFEDVRKLSELVPLLRETTNFLNKNETKNTDLIIMYLLVSILNKLDDKVVKKEEVVEKIKKV